jgi:uncharacterized protein YjaZ
MSSVGTQPHMRKEMACREHVSSARMTVYDALGASLVSGASIAKVPAGILQHGNHHNIRVTTMKGHHRTASTIQTLS